MSRRDEALPLSDFPAEHQARIAAAVALPKPPPRWLDFGFAQMESRAWYEWHWQRGRDPLARREQIPDGLRAAVYDRDGNACLHCGASEGLTLDHIYPYSLGGPDTMRNLQTLCRPCNSRKGAKP